MIDRKALVRRHNPVIRKFDQFSSLSVGNGEYAFTVDATGLQTFPDLYKDGGVPLGNFSNWAWHTFPNPAGYSVEKFPKTYYQTFNGRSVGFPYNPPGNITEEYKWLRFNPHKLHFGHVSLRLVRADGGLAQPEDITDIEQVLDMWTGIITSRFVFEGHPVQVETCCHPELDLVSVRIRSGLVPMGRLGIGFHFAYGTWKFAGTDYGKPDRHETDMISLDATSVLFRRKLDEDGYAMKVEWSPEGELERADDDRHLFILMPQTDGDTLECCFRYTLEPDDRPLPDVAETQEASRSHWEQFWMRGGAVELIESRDERAKELERRIVLSQYLTKIQSSGSLPPAESGLTHNSWAGKFHMEMHWWHGVHFALWNRVDLLENNLRFYFNILDKARELAASQGYEGARWPKCTPPNGENAPCYIEPFLIWQQPHPIYYAELIYRIRPERETLEKYREIVFETATFMASFAEWDAQNERYVLGPPVAPAQEIYDHATTMNPTFELSYWAFGLRVALEWRKRLGLEPVEKWEHVLKHLSKLPVHDGLYVAAETAMNTFSERAGVKDHPTMLGPLGILPGDLVDPDIMRNTLHEVIRVWDWDATWGWDYPMVAMTAARLGEGHLAIDALLMDKVTNTYLPNGHNYQRKPLTVYLPGNGGLLTAIAMMAAGWEGGPDVHAPGFPQDGSWTVKFENLVKML